MTRDAIQGSKGVDPVMKRRHAFCPPAVSQLECRVALSHAGAPRGPSVVVGGLHPRQQVLNVHQQSVIAEVNQAFDSFTSDYDQARATYLASIQGVSNTSAAMTSMNAFTAYTKMRVSLLSQQVISSFLQTPQANARAHGKDNVLKQLVNSKLIGPQNSAPAGSLASELMTSLPQPGTSAATASLYSLAQDNAIESARIAVINGINIVKNGDFGTLTPHKYNSHE